MGKSIDEVIQGALMHGAHPYDPNKYDPQKAHEYYMRTRQLKGRPHGSKDGSGGKGRGKGDGKPSHKISPSAQKQIDHLTSRLHELQARLRELLANAKKRDAGKKDHHKTAAEKSKDAREAKKYRDAHKTELAAKAKKRASKSGGGGGGHSSGIGSMTESQVRAEIARVRSNLQAAIAKARAASRGTA